MTDTVKAGDTIRVGYTGKLESGEVFDSSEGREGLKFTVGAGQLIKGFDQAVVGMAKGEKKTVTIPPEEGYGPRDDSRMVDIPASAVPEDMDIKEGMQLQLTDPNGTPVMAVVDNISSDTIKMDLNHVLAGRTLVFDIQVEELGLTPDAPGCGDQCGGCDSSSGCDC